jgi:hypothetical protein
MNRTVVVPLVALLVVVGPLALAGVPPVAAQEAGTVIGSPELSVTAADNRFEPGEQRSLAVTVANAGTLVRGGPARFEERVTTARSVRVEVARDRLDDRLARGLRLDDGAVLLPAVPGSAARTANLSVGVGRSLPPGTYELPLRVSYEYTSLVRFGTDGPEYSDTERTLLLRVPVVVEARPRLELVDAGGDPVAPGTVGRYTLTVTNAGTERATDVALRLRTDDVAVHLGGKSSAGPTTDLFLGDLAPGDSRTVTVTVGAYESTTPGRYLLKVIPTYRLPGGLDRTAPPLRAGVRVARRPATDGGGGSAGLTPVGSATNATVPPRAVALPDGSRVPTVPYRWPDDR